MYYLGNAIFLHVHHNFYMSMVNNNHYQNFQLIAMNGMSPGDLLTHRVSGYYTSSQSSVADQKFGESFLFFLPRVLYPLLFYSGGPERDRCV